MTDTPRKVIVLGALSFALLHAFFAERSARIRWVAGALLGPVLYAAVHFSESPAGVAQYLTKFGKSGMADLTFSLQGGQGGVDAGPRGELGRARLGPHARPADGGEVDGQAGLEPGGLAVALVEAACENLCRGEA